MLSANFINTLNFAYRMGKYSDAVYWIDAAIPIPVITNEVY